MRRASFRERHAASSPSSAADSAMKPGRVLAASERLAREDREPEVAGGRDAVELELRERPVRPGERGGAILGPDDHLRDQRVVERRDPVALEDVRVDADARPERRAEARRPCRAPA